MGALRIEPARAQPWSPRSLAVIWRSFDLQLTIYALLLTSIGLAMAYSNSVESGGSLFARDSTFVRGLMWAGLSMLVFAIATAFDYAWLKTLAWPIYFTNLGLLAATLVVGSGVGGTARWIPILGLQFQFSELAKILMIVVLANFLASRQGKLDSIWSILGACMLVAPALVLVMLQPDLGTSLVFVAILGGMLFMSGASLRWLGVLAAAAVPASYVAWTYLLRDYQKARLLSFLEPSQDIQGAGYQLFQSQIAVMPITGIPLPFVTHGGASLISLALGLGILQSINMHQARAEW